MKKPSINILAFDTSNYTTSACVFNSFFGVQWEKRSILRVRPGECGVRQNDAVFLHNQTLGELFKDYIKEDIDIVAASSCPSERENSYMPCFTVGMSFGKAVSKILGVPFYSCSHQKNHIAAAIFSSGAIGLLNIPFIAYHISGGTTDICLCLPSKKGVFSVQKVGGTADISCGQLIDRVGVKMDLPFPCGKRMEMLSHDKLSGNIKIKNNDGYYNFSGFQNKADDMMLHGESPEDIATYTLNTVYSFILDSVKFCREKFGNLPILMSGGVTSNKIISEHVLSNIDNIYFSTPEFSCDHSVGTAFLCAYERGHLNDR